jgi:peptide deformylase
MSVRPILLYPDPILRRSCAAVTEFGPELAALVDDLAETMYAAPGVGLAAPQIGIAARVAVVNVTPGVAGSPLHVLVNPRLVEAEGSETDSEGCLSIPGLAEKVERPRRVRVAAQDVDGAPRELAAEGFLARAICHEIDHLDGILFFDRLAGLRKELAVRRLRKLPFLREGVARAL